MTDPTISPQGTPEPPGRADRSRSARRRTLAALALAAALVGTAVIYLARKADAPNPLALPSAATAPEVTTGALPFHPTPRPLPTVRFTDDRGRQLTLANFRGKVVLLNVWATWCPPCRKEMPALDGLQSKIGGPDFEVIAVSIDQGPQGLYLVQEFYLQTGVKSLRIFMDSAGDASRDLEVLGLPTSLLIDRSGREISRVVGPREWDSPEMVAAIRRYLASAARPAAEAS